jgi:hypothetical protein
MHRTLTRRSLLTASVSLAAGVSLFPIAAISEEECGKDDQSGLRSSLNYVEKYSDPAKTCEGCTFFTAAKGTCGNCQILNGAVSPKGHCDSWAAKS